MPLAFPSKSHGTIAFGFFNIDTDMLLLEHWFFFADRFCDAVLRLGARNEVQIPGWSIDDPCAVGDLHAAIRGETPPGFLGAVYQVFPFPSQREAFRQKTDGHVHQGRISQLIAAFGSPQDIPLCSHRETSELSFGEYVFDMRAFAQLVAYVDRGGYPRWKDDQRPEYVRRMMLEVERIGIPAREI